MKNIIKGIFIAVVAGLLVFFITNLFKKDERLPKHLQSSIITYLKERASLIDCVEEGSSAYYYLKSTDTFEGVENLSDIKVEERIANANKSLLEVKQKFNLKLCE